MRARAPTLPDLPTVIESGLPEYEAAQWYGILVPAGTPDAIVTRLNREFVHSVQAPELAARLHNEASFPIGNTPGEFASFFKADIVKWARVVKLSGARAE